MGRKADFTKRTKEIIASRAGYRCSFPGCGRITTGMGPSTTGVESTGMAAHVYSAADIGPRGTGGLTIEQRRAPENGMWVCYKHGKLIDSERAKRYPAHLLQAWKKLHEARIDYEHRGIPIPIGWIHSIVFGDNPLIVANSHMDLSKLTLFTGKNGVGKTSVCEWLAATLGQIENVERWAQPTANRIVFKVKYADPEPHEVGVEFKGRKVTYLRDGIPCRDMSPFFTVIYIKDNDWPYKLLDNIAILSHFLGISTYRVLQLIDYVQTPGIDLINAISIKDYIPDKEDDLSKYDDDINKAKIVEVRMEAGRYLLPIRNLSSGEFGRLIALFAIALADFSARSGPTLLIFEVGGKNLDDKTLSYLSQVLMEPRFIFQTILVSAREHTEVDRTGWSIVKFVDNPPKVQFEQDLLFF